jgi:hypothetical protein
MNNICRRWIPKKFFLGEDFESWNKHSSDMKHKNVLKWLQNIWVASIGPLALKWVLDHFTEKSFNRIFFDRTTFDRNTIWPNTVWPNTIWPKHHLTIWPGGDKEVGHTYYSNEKWTVSQMTIFWKKNFRSNDHFSKKTFGQMTFRSNDHFF